MSDNEEKKEKVVTKYDLKMERRRAEKEKEERNKKITMTVAGICVAAVVVWILSIPVSAYMASNGTFIKINDEKITKTEFEYNYNNEVNEYLNMYGAYASYFGLDVNSDFADQEYSDGLTWKDYFEEQTVDRMKTHKGIKAEAEASGFTFDTAEKVSDFKDSVKKAAKTASTSVGKYLKQRYGQYASMGNITKYVAEDAFVTAYMEKISDDLKPTDEEIQTYYEENAEDYDVVDYYVSEFPADLADSDFTDEQVEAAMKEAGNLADEALDTIMENGELQTDVVKSDAESVYADWLFDGSRKEGDTVVISDDENHIYYAIGFVSRHLNDAPTANARIIVTTEKSGQEILDEWNAGDATEDGFVALWKKYSEVTSVTDGLYENISEDGLDSELTDWIFAEERQPGDTGAVTVESSGTNYVIYYIGEGYPSWKADISNTLLTDAVNEYEEQFTDTVTVQDEKGNLNYLKVQAAQDAEAAEDVSGDDTVSENDAAEGDAVSGNAAE